MKTVQYIIVEINNREEAIVRHEGLFPAESFELKFKSLNEATVRVVIDLTISPVILGLKEEDIDG